MGSFYNLFIFYLMTVKTKGDREISISQVFFFLNLLQAE